MSVFSNYHVKRWALVAFFCALWALEELLQSYGLTMWPGAKSDWALPGVIVSFLFISYHEIKDFVASTKWWKTL